jgi:hypothetical protein
MFDEVRFLLEDDSGKAEPRVGYLYLPSKDRAPTFLVKSLRLSEPPRVVKLRPGVPELLQRSAANRNFEWFVCTRAYGSNYVEALRVQVHANARIRRIFFSDKLYSEAELPDEFKLITAAAKVERAAHAKPARALGAAGGATKHAAAAAAAAAAAPAAEAAAAGAEAEEVLAQDGAPVAGGEEAAAPGRS